MNLYAILLVSLFSFIPLALLYRVLNPLEEKPKEVKRIVGARRFCDIRHLQAAVEANPDVVKHWAAEDALDALQIAEEARQKAARDLEIARQKANQEEFEASLLGRAAQSAITGLVWVLLAVIALLVLSPLFFIFAGLGSTIGFIILIAWCLNDFKNDVATEVVRRQNLTK